LEEKSGGVEAEMAVKKGDELKIKREEAEGAGSPTPALKQILTG